MRCCVTKDFKAGKNIGVSTFNKNAFQKETNHHSVRIGYCRISGSGDKIVSENSFMGSVKGVDQIIRQRVHEVVAQFKLRILFPGQSNGPLFNGYPFDGPYFRDGNIPFTYDDGFATSNFFKIARKVGFDFIDIWP